tara:strand:- start:945 stop:1574 length:630 start_codon:yes stop_codon:yes gene_type:complete
MPKKKKVEKPIYKEYIVSPDWQKMRRWAFYKLGNKCEVCEASENIQIHHNNYGSLGNERPQADLVILCGGCHYQLHQHIPSWKLGKRSVGFSKGGKCTLCMSNRSKKTKYLSCGLSTQPGHSSLKKKPKVHRTLYICVRCIQAIGPRLLEENKQATVRRKKILKEQEQAKAKKERKKKEAKKAKKPKKIPPLVTAPQVVVIRRPSKKTT